MNNPPAPPSSPPLKREFRLELNNWLQSRGWRDRLTPYSEEYREGNGGNLIRVWFAVYKCSFHLSPRLLDVYLRPTVDGRVYGESKSYESAKAAKEEAARIAYRRLLWEEAKPVVRNRFNKPGS